jgi:hypothetical protein
MMSDRRLIRILQELTPLERSRYGPPERVAHTVPIFEVKTLI